MVRPKTNLRWSKCNPKSRVHGCGHGRLSLPHLKRVLSSTPRERETLQGRHHRRRTQTADQTQHTHETIQEHRKPDSSHNRYLTRDTVAESATFHSLPASRTARLKGHWPGNSFGELLERIPRQRIIRNQSGSVAPKYKMLARLGAKC